MPPLLPKLEPPSDVPRSLPPRPYVSMQPLPAALSKSLAWLPMPGAPAPTRSMPRASPPLLVVASQDAPTAAKPAATAIRAQDTLLVTAAQTTTASDYDLPPRPPEDIITAHRRATAPLGSAHVGDATVYAEDVVARAHTAILTGVQECTVG
jgi:hypothetical protein